MRALLVVAVLSALPCAARAECPWKEPKSGPVLTVDDGVAFFEWPFDKAWFDCAKKAGATVTVRFELAGKDGVFTPFKEEKRTGAGQRTSIWRSGFCERKPLPRQVRVVVTGTGEAARAAHTTDAKPIHCDRCELRSYEGHFAIHVKSRLTPPGRITFDGAYDKAFRDCAVQDGDGTLQLRLYVGKSETEARERTDHTFVIDGLEKTASFKRELAESEPCGEGATWIGAEYFGTGEFAQLNGSGRSAVETKCARK